MISANKKNIAALILAAGESKRMMYPKSLLTVSYGTRFIDKIIFEFNQFGCEEIIIVTNKDLSEKIADIKSLNYRIIINEHLEFERFYSIKIGLQELRDYNFCFIHNVDNPFINAKVLENLYKNKFVEGCVYPSFNDKGGHPILIGNKIIQSVINEERNDLNFREYLNNYKHKNIDVTDDSVLININTMNDYKHYFQNI